MHPGTRRHCCACGNCSRPARVSWLPATPSQSTTQASHAASFQAVHQRAWSPPCCRKCAACMCCRTHARICLSSRDTLPDAQFEDRQRPGDVAVMAAEARGPMLTGLAGASTYACWCCRCVRDRTAHLHSRESSETLASHRRMSVAREATAAAGRYNNRVTQLKAG